MVFLNAVNDHEKGINQPYLVHLGQIWVCSGRIWASFWYNYLMGKVTTVFHKLQE